MPRSLAELTTPTDTPSWRTKLLAALQGLGIVTPGGLGGGSSKRGSGSVTLSGSPAQAYPSCVLKISTAGELGVAEFQLSTDAGASYGAAAVISGAAQVLGATGVSATFAGGAAGAGTSFQVGDTFSFTLSVSTLPVTSWQSGGAFRTLVEIEAEALAELSSVQAALAAGGLTSLSSSDWLDLLAENFYDLERNAAAVASVDETLTAASGAGPYTIAVGAISVADAAGHRFTNSTGGVLAAGPSTLTLTFQAELVGAVYNVSAGTLTTIVAGTLPGVTVSNAAAAGGGADIESDDSLRSRCQAQWPQLGTGSTASVYDAWAKAAVPAVTRTKAVASTTVAGRVDLYLAGAAGPSSAPDVSAVDADLQPRIPLTAALLTQAAVSKNITVTGVITYRVSEYGSVPAVTAAITAALNALLNAGDISDGSGLVYWSQVVAALQDTRGVISVGSPQINGGVVDISLALGEVAVLLANSCSYVGI